MLYIRCMTRTQIYLPKDLYQEIALKAKVENKAKAVIIREALEDGLNKKLPKRNAGSVLLEIAAMADKLQTKGPKDLSINHDKYLYEDE